MDKSIINNITEKINYKVWKKLINKYNQAVMIYHWKCPGCGIEQDFIGCIDTRQCPICNP